MTTSAFTTRYLADGTAIVTDSSDASARYIVWQDESPECPNDWNDATAYVFRAAYLRGDVDAPDCELSEVFYRVYGEHGDADAALSVTRRYARVFLGWTAAQSVERIDTYSARGHSQGDWWDVLAIDPAGYAENHARTWEEWVRGDVYCVMREELHDAANCAHPGCDGEHWTAGDILSGIYADEPENAVAHAMSNGLS